MNERIEELVMIAIALDATETVRVGRANREGDWLYQYSEKFAEVVVRKCVDTLYQHGWTDAADDMKQHFGVEE